jgi:hypothetical protein
VTVDSAQINCPARPGLHPDADLDHALMADNKSCDEVHPTGTHMGRSA